MLFSLNWLPSIQTTPSKYVYLNISLFLILRYLMSSGQEMKQEKEYLSIWFTSMAGTEGKKQ